MERSPRILIVEDDHLVRDGVSAALRGLGYTVQAEPDGREIEDLVDRFVPDLVVLDVNLPEGPDGFSLAERLRSRRAVPIVFMTARDEIDDRLRGFDLGADDYVVKPFSVRELAARVRAVLRRSDVPVASVVTVRDVTIDIAARSVHRAGQPVSLTPTEFDLLKTLMGSPDVPWSKRALLEEVWGFSDHAPHLVEVQISGLRRKLEAEGPRIVVTCRDGSYMVPR